MRARFLPAAIHSVVEPPTARRRTAAGLVAVAAALSLAACAQPVQVAAPPSANDAACSAVMLALPVEIDGNAKRTTTSQSTAAWGDPASLVFRCGAEEPGPTADPCTTVGQVDWVAHEREPQRWTLRAYGRTPVMEADIDTSKVSSANVAQALGDAVSRIPASKRCEG